MSVTCFVETCRKKQEKQTYVSLLSRFIDLSSVAKASEFSMDFVDVLITWLNLSVLIGAVACSIFVGVALFLEHTCPLL